MALFVHGSQLILKLVTSFPVVEVVAKFVGQLQVEASAAALASFITTGWLTRKIWLLVIYAKSVTGNIPAHILKSIREAIEHE